jgi:predicted nucleic acid-binding protein
MNVGESQPSFIDSNIWLYRFIINPRDPDAIPKQQIATTVTNHQNILISTQVVNEVCSNLIRKAGFDNLQIQNLLEELAEGCEILPVSLETLQYAVKLRDRYSSITSAYIKTPMTGLDVGAIDNLFGYRFRGGKPGIGRVFKDLSEQAIAASKFSALSSRLFCIIAQASNSAAKSNFCASSLPFASISFKSRDFAFFPFPIKE